ncbi:MAG TPA: MraY family glycosyltransferase, partial [Candidatus Aquilonibacter sp.]
MTAALIYTVTFVIAAAIAAIATPPVIRLATHLQIIDGTQEERRVHEVPTPRIGGLAVFFGFASALFVVLGFALSSPYALYPSIAHLAVHQRLAAMSDQFDAGHRLVGLLFGSMLILSVGLWDDIMQMRPRNKFLAQIIVALVSMFYGFVIPGITNPFDHNPNTNFIDFPVWVSVPLTLVWYVGMMNAINFIDGLDVLLSGFALISCL